MPRRALPLGLAAACYLLALVQRPGTVYADTKVDLLVNPQGFLGAVASAWTDQIQLGHVFGGQFGGYLFPMAPWFALGDTLGLPVWLVQRLWFGTVLALAAWGVVRLLDALLDRPRGAPHIAAAVVFVLNPYVMVYANRTTITLAAYAALPWLLLAIHHGLRAPRSWRWPALFALVLTCTCGGVNVAVTGWVLIGPALFVVYERWFGGVGAGALRPFLLRLAPVVALANAWWLVPVRRPRPLRPELPALHRAAGDDLADDEHHRVAAADRLLDQLHRARLRRRAAALLLLRPRAAVPPAGADRLAAGSRAAPAPRSSGRGAGATGRGSCCWRSRAW